jgi:hypothetical protein
MPDMKAFCSVAALLLLAAVVAPASAAEDGKSKTSYMWIDKNGKKQYGDSVPPEYSQVERRVLNRDGIETRRDGAPKSAEQLLEERRQRELLEKRAQHDRFLTTTYNSVHDIERLRDERLDQLAAQVTAAESYIGTLDSRLQALQQRAQQFKPYSAAANARRMPDDLAEQLVRGQSEAVSQRQALNRKRQEMADVRAQFDADSVRFSELEKTRSERNAGMAARPGSG